MVVEGGDDNLIPHSNEFSAKGLCHKVDTLSSASYEDYLFGRRGIDEFAHFFARAFIGISGLGGKGVGTTVDITVVVGVIITDGINHLSGLLGCGSIIEPYKGMTVYSFLENGEILAYLRGTDGVGILVVDSAYRFSLGDSYSKTVILYWLSYCSRIIVGKVAAIDIREAELRKSRIRKSAASRQQLAESSLYVAQVKCIDRVGNDLSHFLAYFLGAELGGYLAQASDVTKFRPYESII